MQHYRLIGVECAGKNDKALMRPKYQAPVVSVRDGECSLDHMR